MISGLNVNLENTGNIMLKKDTTSLKSQKGDCSKCKNHGICLAEVNKPHYYCPIVQEQKQEKQ